MQTNLVLVTGIVGSVASVVGLLISAPGRKSKFVHVGYALFITILATLMFGYRQEVEEMHRTERQADAILQASDRSTSGSMAGFMLASLSFLEKNKLHFPDTYARAVKLCETSGCAGTSDTGSRDEMEHFRRMQDASGAMFYLMKGIAVGAIGN